MMEQRERLLQTLRGQAVDRVPCICPGGMMNMAVRELQTADLCFPEAHTDAKKMAALARRAAEWGVFENVGVPFCMTVEAEAYGAPIDFGNADREPRVAAYPLKRLEDWRQLQPVNLEQGRVATVLEAIRLLKNEDKDAPIVGNLTGPISIASSIIEPVLFFKALRRQNEEAHAYMDFITQDTLRFALAQIEAGADLLAISDPSGTGEILGPKFFKEFCVCYLNRIVDAVRERGVPCIVHICGQMSSVFAEVNEIRASALSFDSLVSLRQAQEALPGRLLMGNVSTYALEFSSPERIRSLAERCVRDGSAILSPACGLGMHSPLANVKAIREAVVAREERETPHA